MLIFSYNGTVIFRVTVPFRMSDSARGHCGGGFRPG
jgi:hypothetical protein